MSYITSTIKCENCGKEMNVAFGFQGMEQIAVWPTECPVCQSTKLIKISDGWNTEE